MSIPPPLVPPPDYSAPTLALCAGGVGNIMLTPFLVDVASVSTVTALTFAAAAADASTAAPRLPGCWPSFSSVVKVAVVVSSTNAVGDIRFTAVDPVANTTTTIASTNATTTTTTTSTTNTTTSTSTITITAITTTAETGIIDAFPRTLAAIAGNERGRPEAVADRTRTLCCCFERCTRGMAGGMGAEARRGGWKREAGGVAVLGLHTNSARSKAL